MTKTLSFSLGIMLSLTLLSSCVRNPVTGKKQFAVMSEEREIAMGKAYDPQIVAEFGLYEDDEIQSYIDQRGKEMAAVSHRPHLDYEFKIMDSPVVNAFAVPGGYVYFTRGIMAHFNNEAEFSGVLGHEIGHITARHSVLQQRNSTFAQIGLIAGMVVSPEFASMAQSASAGVQLMLLKFGRDAESQSDELGVEYSTKIGYDAHQMADFFNTLSRKSEAAGARVPEFMSTHPDPLNRKERVHQLAEEQQASIGNDNWTVGRNSYLEMIDGLVYGPDPRQGFVENWVFYHPEMAFQFPIPESWQYQNTPSQFKMAPEGGKGLMFLALASGESLEDASAAKAEQYGLQILEQNRRSINGIDALEIKARQMAQAQAGQETSEVKLEVMMTLYQFGDLILEMSAASSPADMPALQSRFRSSMRGFARLTDTDKLNRQPERIDIRTLGSQQSLRQALLTNGISEERLEEFAVLNGMHLDDNLPAGTHFKVIE